MVMLQIDIPPEMSKKLKIFKIINNFDTQEQAMLFILQKTLVDKEEQD